MVKLTINEAIFEDFSKVQLPFKSTDYGYPGYPGYPDTKECLKNTATFEII